MNKYLKAFLTRGLMFGGFGPIIVGIIMYIVSYFDSSITTTITQMFLAIVSSYLLAFIHAGSSIFNQIDEWPISKSIAIHLSCLYITYLACYLINSWIPFDWKVVIIFTLIFIVTYAIIWTIVYFATKKTARKLNSRL